MPRRKTSNWGYVQSIGERLVSDRIAAQIAPIRSKLEQKQQAIAEKNKPAYIPVEDRKPPMPFAEFFRLAWDVLEPGSELLHNWHQDLICEYLEAVSLGQITRLAVNIPPRYSKSTLATIAYPCWEWTFRPETRWIFASYSLGLSTDHSLARRHLITSDWYQENFGHVFQLAGDQNLKTQFANNHRGQMVATSMGGTVTGKGGKLVIDDPLNPGQAMSDAMRSGCNQAFDLTLSTRLNDKKKDPIILIMQRLHEDDMTSHLLAKGGYTHLKLSAIAEQDEKIIFPVSGRVFERKVGDLLHPEREDWTEIEQRKKDLGSYGFAGQYQQNPAPLEGGLFKRSWWQYYRVRPKFDALILSVDCAFKQTASSDYVVMQVWGKIEDCYYLVDQVRDRMDINGTLAALVALAAKYPTARAKLIEDKANGSAVIDLLRRKIAGLIPVNPEGGKVVRANAIAPYVESGNVFLPEAAAFTSDFVEEFAVFPNGSNDDQVDAASQAITYLEEHFHVSNWGSSSASYG